MATCCCWRSTPTSSTAPLKWERAADVGDEFPHIYGPLNIDAVVGTIPLPEGPDGYEFSG